MVEGSRFRDREPGGICLEVFHAAKPSEARSRLGEGSPGLDFSSSPAGGGAGKGRAGGGHWRENVRNVPGASTYPRRGQRKGAGRGEGRGARLRIAGENLFVLLRAEPSWCLLSYPARSPLRPAPRAPRPPTRSGPVRSGTTHSREPARPSARPTSRAPVPGRAVESPSDVHDGEAERGTRPVPC